MINTFSNKYGSLTIESVSDIISINGLKGANLSNDIKFSIEDSEKITLIMDASNCNKIQLAPNGKDLNLWWMFYHTDSSHGYICKVTELNFNELVNARKQIEKDNKLQYNGF